MEGAEAQSRLRDAGKREGATWKKVPEASWVPRLRGPRTTFVKG